MSVLTKLDAFTVQEISNSIWAMAKLAYYDESLLDKVGLNQRYFLTNV